MLPQPLRVRAVLIASGNTAQVPMDENDFEGTLVLERLAAIDRVDAFLEAIDADDFARASSLMKQAGLDSATIAIVLKKMADPGGNH
jgi:hypothetical protein